MPTTFLLGRDKNRVSITGSFNAPDVRRVFSTIHSTINVKGYSEIILDFSKCTTTFSNSMLPLCAHVLSLRQNRIDVDIILPENILLSRLFINTGWAHFLCPRNHDQPRISSTARQIPAVQYANHDEQNQTLNRLVEKLLEQIEGFDRRAFAAVEWALNEISDNVLNHSQSGIGGLIQLSIFDRTKRAVEFTVSDSGLGIPATLRQAKPEISNDADALLQAVRSGVTRDATDFQGNGLYGTLEICRVGGGRFSVNSGYSALIYAHGAVSSRVDSVQYEGTSIDAVVDFSQPDLLRRALSIDGKLHAPVDYIEHQYEQDDLRAIKFPLEGQGFSFRSRPAGKPVRNKLANLIKACPGQSVLINFSGISVISSSFADEVFGKLFVELGPMRFMQTVRFVGISPTVQALIDRAITQRMREG